MKRTILLVGVCCALMATAAVDAAKSVAKADEAPTKEAIDRALADLFAERESWGTAPAGGQASAAGSGVAESATGDLAGFLALRATWGTGPAPKAVNAPLAKGASSNFPVAKSAASPGPTPDTIVHPEVDRPLPKLAADSQADIVRARNALMKERESWGTKPSKSIADPSSATASTATGGTGDLAALLTERESWGTGPAVKTVNPPLAKGAKDKLELARAAVTGEAKPPIVHELEPRPIPKVAEIAPAKIREAMNNLLKEREGWGTAPSAGAAQAATATGGTGDLAALLTEREGWGTGPAVKTVNPPLAKGAKDKLELARAAVTGEAKPPIVHELEPRPIPKVAEIAPAKIREAMNNLLKEREGWGTAPSAGAAQAATATGGTGDLAALLTEREGWGTGPAVKTVKPPLAKGAKDKLELARAAVTGEAKPPIVHELEPRPIPKVAEIAPAKIREAMNNLLKEREGWGTAPSAGAAQAATATGGTGDLAALLTEREGWGTGPAVKTVKPPLAKGAKDKLELARAAVTGEAKPPIVHELEPRPIPKVAEIAPAKIREAMNNLLKEREGWGTAPSAGAAQAATATGGTGDLAALLAERGGWGTGPSQTVAAASTSSTAGRSACSEDLRRLASERKIFFSSASARLQPKSNEALELIAKTIKDCGDVVILIEGHTDSIGPTQANKVLSEARALSVLEFLATSGIDRSRLQAIGHGESKPVTSNATSKDRALNRRIEFSIR